MNYSNCCLARVRIVSDGMSSHHECDQCGNACDIRRLDSAIDRLAAEQLTTAAGDAAMRLGWAACEDRVRSALGGDPDSQLWGEHGLLAATMRCVRARQEREDDGK